jgi:hypothetical protein
MAPPMGAQAYDQGGVVPLMHDHHIHTVQNGIDIQPLQMVEDTAQMRVQGAEFAYRGLAVLLDQLDAAPGVVGLEHRYLVPAGL